MIKESKTNSIDLTNDSCKEMLNWMNDFTKELSRYNDIGVLLDRILLEGRITTHADAGTIFLVDGNTLSFANIHNNTLFPGSAANKHAYANTSLHLDNTSVAGYVALTRKVVNIADMRNIENDMPFNFNETLDNSTGYKTISTLTFPIIGNRDETLGVIQLINSSPQGYPEAFTERMENLVQILAGFAGSAIERGTLARDFILRMLHMTALRDPFETGPHVQRVGSYSAEIYHRWAERKGIDIDDLRYEKSRIRLAAMLHDVGKVGISDIILKKPGRLNDEEYAVMKGHCALGADIFNCSISEFDQFVRDVALHHHQKWDGSGYTGTDAPPLQGEQIPLAARITAVADVYDALCSQRSYKKAWPPEKALEVIRKDAGTHFDPEIVTCFEDVHDVIEAIRHRYPDSESC
jgi:HD-GYP domain-containing protein (c-di-GMP phosphodiesterase class II)